MFQKEMALGTYIQDFSFSIVWTVGMYKHYLILFLDVNLPLFFSVSEYFFVELKYELCGFTSSAAVAAVGNG